MKTRIFITVLLVLGISLITTNVLASSLDDLATICHKPGDNEVTIMVAASSLNSHFAHGDRQGGCGEVFNICPFEPMAITLSSPDLVSIPVQITTDGQDLNFAANDPPGVLWVLTQLDGSILFEGGYDDHFHFTWLPYDFSKPGYYYVAFDHRLLALHIQVFR